MEYLSNFYRSHRGRITPTDKTTIETIIQKMIKWYASDELTRPPESTLNTGLAKHEIYLNTGLTMSQRRDLAPLIDGIAKRRGNPRWTAPLGKDGCLKIGINENLLFEVFTPARTALSVPPHSDQAQSAPGAEPPAQFSTAPFRSRRSPRQARCAVLMSRRSLRHLSDKRPNLSLRFSIYRQRQGRNRTKR